MVSQWSFCKDYIKSDEDCCWWCENDLWLLLTKVTILLSKSREGAARRQEGENSRRLNHVSLHCTAMPLQKISWVTSRNQSFVRPFMFSTGIFKISIYVIPIAVLKNLLKIWEKSGGGFWDLWPKKCPGVQYSRQALSGEKKSKGSQIPVWKSTWSEKYDSNFVPKCWNENVDRRIWKRHLVRATSTDGFSLSVLCITCGDVNQRACDHENNWPQRCMYHRMDLFPRIDTIALKTKSAKS